jgi:glyoxylase-like metal-dependent hydrolase (beta-lactamase superfamily II)
MTPKLFAFTCGWWKADLSFFIGGDAGERIRSPIPAYLIEHPKGLAVFDTGMAERYRIPGRARDSATKHAGLEFNERDDIAAHIRAIGKDPGGVKWIINSHLHADHCGGNASLPNAHVIIQRRELEYARAHADGVLYESAYFDNGQPLILIDGEHDLFGDQSVMLIPTIGHTPGHQSARVQLIGGAVILTADCCYLKRSLDEMRLSAGNWDAEKSLETLSKLRSLREAGVRLFYGHDAEFWKTVPQAMPLEPFRSSEAK